MNVLVIDDSPERIVVFRRIYGSHILYTSEDIAEIVRWLDNEKFDIVQLDYDLTDCTSELIAEAIRAQSQNSIVIIHSDNANGVKALLQILPNALTIPFSKFLKRSDSMSHLKSLLSVGENVTLEEIKQAIEK